MSWIEAFILALIEGLTEFLPVSSTGHMIIGSSLMGISDNEFTKMFTVAIQFGAILSVVVIYFRSFFKSVNFYVKLFAAFIPTAIVGLLAKSYIDSLLENVAVVAISLIAGGIVLLFVDKWFAANERAALPAEGNEQGFPEGEVVAQQKSDENVTYKTAFVIGLFQCIAMIPGVSRSAATIIGGLTQKLTRRAAAEFSFFLAVPTMFAATLKSMYDVYKESPEVITDNIPVLVFGNVVAFVVAIVAIKFFIGILTKHGFRVFGWYRIIAGALILALLLAGTNLAIVD
jgi:undecaprenyl-diphosphatase